MTTLQSTNILVVGDSQDVVVQAIAEAARTEGAAVSILTISDSPERRDYHGVVFVTPALARRTGLGTYLQTTIDAVERTANALQQDPQAGDRSIVIVGRPADDDLQLTIPGFATINGALRGLSRGWAVSLGSLGIRSNWVQPGLAHTTDPDGWTVPLVRDEGRNVLPVDIANIVVFLLSQDAGYVTGAECDVDGGLSEARRSLPAAAWAQSITATVMN